MEGNYFYVGSFFNGLRDGHGVMTNGGNCYVGNFKRDRFHGKGDYTTSNGDRYVGFWCDGKMTGHGFMRWNNGATYTGEWYNGQMHGKGRLSSDAGEYDGEFVNGKKTGNACITLRGTGEKYIGRVKMGRINESFGIIRTSDGDVFQTRPDTFLQAENERFFARAKNSHASITSKYALRKWEPTHEQ